jgi:hypothetical protein
MPRNPLFDRFSRTIRIAWFAERAKISTSEALARAAETRRTRSGADRGARFLMMWLESRHHARSQRLPLHFTRPSQSRATAIRASRSSARAWRALRARID